MRHKNRMILLCVLMSFCTACYSMEEKTISNEELINRIEKLEEVLKTQDEALKRMWSCVQLLGEEVKKEKKGRTLYDPPVKLGTSTPNFVKGFHS